MRVELTEDDIRNGWDQASLDRYHKEREQANAKAIDPEGRVKKPQMQTRYNPLRWRE